MSEEFKVKATKREDLGKGASRRLRRAGDVPGVVYGSGKPVSITLKHSEMLQHVEHEAFFSHVLSLDIDGKSENVIVRDIQRHPSKPFVMHVDFQRVKRGQEFTTSVPLHFVNQDKANGVKLHGGSLNQLATEVNIACVPSKLPEFIEVDVTEIEVGQTLHLSDIDFPKGVRSTDLELGEDHNTAIITCLKARGGETTTEEKEES